LFQTSAAPNIKREPLSRAIIAYTPGRRNTATHLAISRQISTNDAIVGADTSLRRTPLGEGRNSNKTGEATVLSITDKMIFLRRVSIFSSMTLEQIRVLTAHLDEQHFLASEVILREGDFSQELYIIVSGKVRFVKDYGKPQERTLNILETGDFFGEMAIFENAPRSVTAVAVEEAELLVLSPDKFKQTIYQKPDMVFEIFRELSARLRRREEESMTRT
jgi:hypothetical protein